MEAVKQAVVLAGGKGTRLQPLTNNCPKPMIPFHGRPFLAYLLEQLKTAGIERVVLLLGYLAEQVQSYFGDGSRFGLQITYVVSDVEHETGKRIKLAKEKLDPLFLLLYCDNYCPVSFNNLEKKFLSSNSALQLLVYNNSDGYTRDNVSVDPDGKVLVYDKSRKHPNLKGVDIGYMILRKSVLDLMPEGNVSFESTVFPQLVSKEQLTAYTTGHRYYSVGSFSRLPLTEYFLKDRKAIILDRDGVLNSKPEEGDYVKKWAEFVWLPGAREAVALLKKAGYQIFLATNQAGVARGIMKESDVHAIHANVLKDLQVLGGGLDAIYYCPHGWYDHCECRKPKPGMLFRAQRDFHLNLSQTFFLGDDPRDQQAAEEAGAPFLKVDHEKTLLHWVEQKILCPKK